MEKFNNHYIFEINNIKFDVIDILKSIDKKITKNDIVCDRIEFNYYFQALKYLLRCFFKNDLKKDLEKCLTEIDNILKIENKKNKTIDNLYILEIKDFLFITCNDILDCVDKKLRENKININNIQFMFFSQALKYLIRCHFKGQKQKDLKKAKNEIIFLIESL